jgi:GAF domain-containing protein
MLCVPTVVGGEMIGAIHMLNKEHGSFTTHDSKLVNSVAASLATAIVSARLHRLCQNIGAPGISHLNGLPE